jgi:hypothetical protein
MVASRTVKVLLGIIRMDHPVFRPVEDTVAYTEHRHYGDNLFNTFEVLGDDDHFGQHRISGEFRHSTA